MLQLPVLSLQATSNTQRDGGEELNHPQVRSDTGSRVNPTRLPIRRFGPELTPPDLTAASLFWGSSLPFVELIVFRGARSESDHGVGSRVTR